MLQHCFCFMGLFVCLFGFFGCKPYEILTHWSGIELEPLQLGGKVLTTGAQSTNLLILFLIHAYILVMFTTSSKEFKLSSFYLLKIFKIFIYRIPFSSKESLPRVFLMFQFRLSGLLDSCHQRLYFSCLLSLSLPFY